MKQWTGEGRTAEEAAAKGASRLGLDRSEVEFQILGERSSGLLSLFGFRRVRVRVTERAAPNDNRRAARTSACGRKERMTAAATTPRDGTKGPNEIYAVSRADGTTLPDGIDLMKKIEVQHPRGTTTAGATKGLARVPFGTKVPAGIKVQRLAGMNRRAGTKVPAGAKAPAGTKVPAGTKALGRKAGEKIVRKKNARTNGLFGNQSGRMKTAPGAEPRPPVAPEVLLAQWKILFAWDDLAWEFQPVQGHRLAVQLKTRHGQRLAGSGSHALEAFEYIFNLLSSGGNRGLPWVSFRIEGFPSAEEQRATDQAMHAAFQVRRSNQPFRMEPMTPALRRLVHQALANHPDVETASEGEGSFRRVVVKPRTLETNPETAGAESPGTEERNPAPPAGTF